jgi:hypothetical protein
MSRICFGRKLLAVAIAVNAFAGVPSVAAAPKAGNANELQIETLAAWEEYIRGADLRMKARLNGQTSFLWTDESAERAQRIGRGEILIAPALSHGARKVPNGLIHHWIGGIFIPGATVDGLAAVVENYGSYKDFYKPVVVDSKFLACTPADQKFWMLWQHKVLFITAAIEGEYQAHHVRVDAHRGYSVAESIQVREIENYGRPEQRLLPPGTGSGYVWRLHSIARYEQRAGGVSLELEAVALTRDIPASMRWLVNPIVNHLSINSLTTTLQQTRDAVQSPARTETAAVCWNQQL